MVLTSASAAWSVTLGSNDLSGNSFVASSPAAAMPTPPPLLPTTPTTPEAELPPTTTTTSPGPPPVLGVSGTTWVTSASYTAAPGFAGISCPSTSVCYAAGTNSSQGGDVLISTDAGSVWREETLPAGIGGVTGIACPDTATCYATDNNGVLLTTDEGTRWSFHALLPSSGNLDAIACPSLTACYAAGQHRTPSTPVADSPGVIVGTTDAGATWHVEPQPAPSELATISCPTVSSCVAIDEGFDYLHTINSGQTWTEESSVPGGYDQALSCPSTTMCVSVGLSGILLTTDAGSAWTSQPLPGGVYAGLLGVTCPSTTECFAVGATGQNDESGGGEIIASTAGRERMACPDPDPMVRRPRSHRLSVDRHLRGRGQRHTHRREHGRRHPRHR